MRYFAVFGYLNLPRVLGAAAAYALAWATAGAATQPIYYVDQEIDSPPAIAPSIDATRVVIRNRFNVSSVSTIPQPYQTLNTIYFTNTPSGIVIGTPGFRYDHFFNNTRKMMGTWVNQGNASGATWYMVWSTNIASTGPITTGPDGLLRLHGQNIDLAGSGLRAGLEPGASLGDGFTAIYQTNYSSAPGITEIYWGAGTNNYLNDQGPLMNLGITNAGFFGALDVPCTLSPLHQVHDTRTFFGTGTFTNFVSVPQTLFTFGDSCFKQFDAHAFVTNIPGQNLRIVQVAFVSRNLFDSNMTTRVRFIPDQWDGGTLNPDEGQNIVVELGTLERDLVTGRTTTNSLYFIDRSAFTNAYLQRPFLGGTTRKPSVYEVARLTPFAFTNAVASAGNTPFSSSLLYNSGYASNTVPVSYAAYRVRVESALSKVAGRHPTNTPGRIEIVGDNVNLDRARIKAETTAIIRARTLSGNAMPRVDAPFCAFDIGASGSQLVVSNLTPPYVQRLSGEIAAWSATWDNFEVTGAVTNTIRFHVLVLDNELQSLQPVVVTDLALRAPHLVLRDPVNVQGSFYTDASSLHITGGLGLPFGASWRSNNVPNLIHLTNDGTLNIPGAARFGTDRPNGYVNFVNRGTNIASSQFIRAQNVENRGCIVANAGLLSIEASAVNMVGGLPTVTTNLVTNVFTFGTATFTNIELAAVTNIPGKLQGKSDIQIVANNLSATDSYIHAGAGSVGSLSLSIANQLSDGGPNTSNYWAASAGIHLNPRPASGANLLGTTVASLPAHEGQQVFHTWPGQDRGAWAAGFDNNFALQKLTLDGTPSAVFRFNPPAGQASGAIYVDYLELLNFATNYNSIFDLAPGFTIYFANANVPPSKLDELPGLTWVSSYVGSLSETNIVYPTPPYPAGTVVRANVALTTSKDIDSDADGIVNADDPDPFFISQSVGLTIQASKSGDALLSWNALGRAENVLECANVPQGNNWVVVTNFVQGAQTTRVRVRESLSQTNQRIYRVRVNPPQ